MKSSFDIENCIGKTTILCNVRGDFCSINLLKILDIFHFDRYMIFTSNYDRNNYIYYGDDYIYDADEIYDILGDDFIKEDEKIFIFLDSAMNNNSEKILEKYVNNNNVTIFINCQYLLYNIIQLSNYIIMVNIDHIYIDKIHHYYYEKKYSYSELKTQYSDAYKNGDILVVDKTDIPKYINIKNCFGDKPNIRIDNIYEYIDVDCGGDKQKISSMMYSACNNNNLEIVKYIIDNYDVDISEIFINVVNRNWINVLKLILENYYFYFDISQYKNIFLNDIDEIVKLIIEYQEINYLELFLQCFEYNSYRIIDLLISKYEFDEEFIIKNFKNAIINKKMDIAILLMTKFDIKFTINNHTSC